MLLRTSILGLFTMALPLLVQAGNPHILIKGDPPNPTVIVGDDFTFGADQFGGGVFTFQNESGSTWRDLLVSATLPAFTTITCGPGPFQTCTISQTPGNGDVLYDILFGPAATGGVVNGEIFSINLNDDGDDPEGVGSWGPGNDFAAKANVPTATPEPSVLMLMLVGGAGIALFGWRRRRMV